MPLPTKNLVFFSSSVSHLNNYNYVKMRIKIGFVTSRFPRLYILSSPLMLLKYVWNAASSNTFFANVLSMLKENFERIHTFFKKINFQKSRCIRMHIWTIYGHRSNLRFECSNFDAVFQHFNILIYFQHFTI